MLYRRRLVEKQLLTAAKHFPVLLLTGPRQSGKSTTLQALHWYDFVRKHP